MIYTFLNDFDLFAAIREHHLDEITDEDDSIIQKAEAAAVGLIKSKLNKRYVLTDLLSHQATEFDADETYDLDSYVYLEYQQNQRSKAAIFKLTNIDGAETKPSEDEENWSKEDPRDQLLIKICVRITMYFLFDRMNLSNIPEDIMANYEASVEWLDMVKDNEEHPDFPLKEEGNSKIRSGGMVSRGHFIN